MFSLFELTTLREIKCIIVRFIVNNERLLLSLLPVIAVVDSGWPSRYAVR